jgi:hypothetical protein
MRLSKNQRFKRWLFIYFLFPALCPHKPGLTFLKPVSPASILVKNIFEFPLIEITK